MNHRGLRGTRKRIYHRPTIPLRTLSSIWEEHARLRPHRGVPDKSPFINAADFSTKARTRPGNAVSRAGGEGRGTVRGHCFHVSYRNEARTAGPGRPMTPPLMSGEARLLSARPAPLFRFPSSSLPLQATPFRLAVISITESRQSVFIRFESRLRCPWCAGRGSGHGNL